MMYDRGSDAPSPRETRARLHGLRSGSWSLLLAPAPAAAARRAAAAWRQRGMLQGRRSPTRSTASPTRRRKNSTTSRPASPRGTGRASTANRPPTARPTTRATRTAAHRTLQMPSIVRVTNLDNGQSHGRAHQRSRPVCAQPHHRPVARRAPRSSTSCATARRGAHRPAPGRKPGGQGGRDRRRRSGRAAAPRWRRSLPAAYGARPAQAPVQPAAYRPAAARSAQPRRPPLRAARAHPAGMADQSAQRGAPSPAPACVPAGSGGPTVASLARATAPRCERRAERRILCADRRLLDAGERREASAALISSYGASEISQGVGRRTRGLSRAPGTLYDRGCRRHRRRPAEALRLW